MATQEILVNYKADVEQLTQQLNKVATAQDKVSDSASQTSKDVKQATITQEQAAKKRLELLKKEEAELKRLQAARKLAYDPKVIADFDRKIAASQQKIALLGKQSSQALGGVSNQIKSIGASIALGVGAAFSVDAIINFSKASVNAFLEAQKNAERLKFAITQVGGESEAVFEKLLEQSKELQEITIFSDDSIQSAQAALSAFGLTGSEIEKLIPKLADFATVTQKSLEEAAQSVGQGLQGMGREFKKYNIAVSATASEQENLNSILNGFSQFAGAAENATKTLSGQLAQATNQADELQEEIGEKLAPAFVKARVAALEFAKEAVDFFLNTDEAMRKLLKTMGLLPAEVAKTSDGFKSFTQEVLAQVDAVKSLSEFDSLAVKLRNDQTEAIAKQQAVIDRLNEAKETALSREVVSLEEVRALNEAIQKQQATNLQNEITKLGIIEEILTKQREVNKVEKEQEDTEKDQALLRKLQIENIEDLKQRRIAAFEEEARTLTAKGKLRNSIIIELEKQLKKDLDEIDKTLGQNIKPIELKVKLVPDEIVPINPVADKLEDRSGTKDFADGLRDGTDEVVEALDDFTDKMQLAQSGIASLTEAWTMYNDVRLQQIEEEKNAQLDALSIQEKALQSNIDKRRVSETEAARLSEELIKKQTEIERQAAEKERAIKRKQAILDKANALIQITINTAQGVSKALATGGPLGFFTAGLITAAGIAQGAIVSSAPIAYKKGSKDTGAKDHMALVGEEGPEMVYMPSHSKVLPAPQTKTYGEALEAMRKKSFDTYVNEKYVTPALVAQRKQDEKTKRKSFAENLAQSITYNTISQTPGKKLQDVSVTNVDALARSIANELKTDIYRR